MNCRRGRHGRTDQMRAATKPWRPSKFAVRCRCAMLSCSQLICVHGQTHGTARLAPLQSGFNKNLVQTFAFCLLFYQSRTRNDECHLDICGYFLAGNDLCRFSQVFDPRVRAGTDEYTVQLNILDGGAAGKPIYRKACSILPRLVESASFSSVGIARLPAPPSQATYPRSPGAQCQQPAAL